MTHQQKIERLIAEVKRKGISEYEAAPPFFRWLWNRGIKIPPPYFVGFCPLAVFLSGFFGIALFVGLGLLDCLELLSLGLHALARSLVVLAIVCAFGGAAFGLTMSAYFRIRARALRLSSWRDYGLSN